MLLQKVVPQSLTPCDTTHPEKKIEKKRHVLDAILFYNKQKDIVKTFWKIYKKITRGKPRVTVYQSHQESKSSKLNTF